jgi:hypothetical protein
MAEEHPPSQALEDELLALEIAGQARNDVLSEVLFCAVT